MARMRCPGCGEWYNGRKCTSCLYVPFDSDETGYRPAAASKRPPVPAPRTAQPVHRPQPYGQNTAPWQRKRKNSGGAKFAGSIVAVLVVMVLSSVINITFSAVEDLTANISYAQPEPAPDLAMPEGGLVLYEEEGLLIMADWEEGTPIEEDIRILVENHTGRDLAVHAPTAAVNGFMQPSVFFYCDAPNGHLSEGILWMDIEQLTQTGMGEVAIVQLCIEAYDAESYETVLQTDVITLKTGIDAAGWSIDTTGTPVFDADGIKLDFLDCRTSDYGTYVLRFYAENNTDRRISLSSTEIGINGQSTDTFLWQDLLPGTRALINVDVYESEDAGIEGIADIETLDFVLYADDPTDWTSIFQTQPLTIYVNP